MEIRDSFFKEPKTRAGVRTIILPEDTVVALKRHKAVQAQEKLIAGSGYKDEGIVVATQIGKPMTHQQVEEAWRKIEEIGITEDTSARFEAYALFNAT